MLVLNSEILRRRRYLTCLENIQGTKPKIILRIFSLQTDRIWQKVFFIVEDRDKHKYNSFEIPEEAKERKEEFEEKINRKRLKKHETRERRLQYKNFRKRKKWTKVIEQDKEIEIKEYRQPI